MKTNGSWKEYLGICTSKTDKEIRFASHGDFLVKVSDSSTFGIGDSVYIEDVEHEGKLIPVLKILSDNIPLTSKIQRTTVGIVTSIIDESTISVLISRNIQLSSKIINDIISTIPITFNSITYRSNLHPSFMPQWIIIIIHSNP